MGGLLVRGGEEGKGRGASHLALEGGGGGVIGLYNTRKVNLLKKNRT